MLIAITRSPAPNWRGANSRTSNVSPSTSPEPSSSTALTRPRSAPRGSRSSSSRPTPHCPTESSSKTRRLCSMRCHHRPAHASVAPGRDRRDRGRAPPVPADRASARRSLPGRRRRTPRGTALFVGQSSRTGEPGLRALGEIARPLGYVVVPVRVTGCLHLKSGCCRSVMTPCSSTASGWMTLPSRDCGSWSCRPPSRRERTCCGCRARSR